MLGSFIGSLKDKRFYNGRPPWTEEERKRHMEYLTSLEARRIASEAGKRGMSSPEVRERLSARVIEMNHKWSKEGKHPFQSSSINNSRVKSERGKIGGPRQKLYWESLSEEERQERLRNSFLSDESIRKSSRSRRLGPSLPERLVDSYFERICPGRWLYNGDYSQGVRVKNRIPDFIRADGTREAISVMGGLGFVHFLGDDEEEVSYYSRNGWRCTVIWEWDISQKACEKLSGVFN